jgi:hypothetical protein
VPSLQKSVPCPRRRAVDGFIATHGDGVGPDPTRAGPASATEAEPISFAAPNVFDPQDGVQ